VDTTVQQNIQFSNRQDFVVTNSVFDQKVAQTTGISSVTTTKGHDGPHQIVQNMEWPFNLDFNFTVNPDGSGSQATTIQQAYNSREDIKGGEGAPFFSVVSNSVSPSDTLLFDASFNITGSQGQANTQKFFSADSTGACFSRTIAAAGGVLTAVTDGVGCDGGKGRDH
jgi:hypothetical protein